MLELDEICYENLIPPKGEEDKEEKLHSKIDTWPRRCLGLNPP